MKFANYLKENSKEIWEACYNHKFVQEIGKGTLDKETFKFYLVQDYSYLLEYAKVFALGAIKSQDEETMTNFSEIQYFTLKNEMSLHRKYMESFGIDVKEAEKEKSSLFNRTYTANMMAEGFKGGLIELLATVLPCAWTYYEYAKRLKDDYPEEYENNFYKSWIDTYYSEDFYNSFAWFFPLMDELSKNITEEEKEKVLDIFKSSVEFEYLFWDMSYKKELSYNI